MSRTATIQSPSIKMTNEVEQIEAAKKEPSKFSVLYDTYYEYVFRFVYQRLDDKDLSFDTTQQVFLKAMDNLQRYEHRGIPFSSWLLRIASNEVMDLFRRKRTIQTVNIDSVSIYNIIEEMEETKIDKFHDVIVEIISNELPDDELKLIEMRFFEKRSFKQIGEILEITESNAKIRTYRILQKLKSVLNDKKQY